MKVKIVLFVTLFVLSVASVFAQQNEEKKYVFVISKVNYLKAIDDAVLSAPENKLEIKEVRVILCGESVKAFAEKDPLIEKTLLNGKIKLQACGLSLEQMKVDKTSLPKNIEVVRNGLLEAMLLESRGYIKYDL